MRIVALADLHHPSGGRRRLDALAEACRRQQADVLMLAGDLTAFSLADFGRVLREFADVAPLRLVVAGNHDVWTHAGLHTHRRYARRLPLLCDRFGFRFLDREPAILDDVAFVGCLGWYDYSLRQVEEPVPGVRVSPAHPSHRSSFSHLKVARGREDLRWDELTSADYRGRGLTYREEGRLRSVVWNDALYVEWQMPDELVVARQVRHLQDCARRVDQAGRLVAVTHTVPFLEAFAEPYPRVDWAFCRAYMGATALGLALEDDPRLTLWITGHVHYQVDVRCRGVRVVNVAAAPEQRRDGPTLICLDGAQAHVQRLPLPR